MIKILDPVVLEMRQLISEGVSVGNEAGSPFPGLHHDLVQHYFKARKVEIDYNTEVVKIELPIGEQYTQVNISCQPLEEFLCSCVKTDDKSLQYYKQILQKFDKVEVA